MDPKRVENKLKFVLHCLASSLDHSGKVKYEDVAKEFGIETKSAGDKLWRIRLRHGLTKTRKKEGNPTKGQEGAAEGNQANGGKRAKQKQEIQPKEEPEGESFAKEEPKEDEDGEASRWVSNEDDEEYEV